MGVFGDYIRRQGLVPPPNRGGHLQPLVQLPPPTQASIGTLNAAPVTTVPSSAPAAWLLNAAAAAPTTAAPNNAQDYAAAALPEAAPQSAAQLQANAAYDSSPPNVAGDPFRDLAQVVVSAGKQAQAVGGDVTQYIGDAVSTYGQGIGTAGSQLGQDPLNPKSWIGAVGAVANLPGTQYLYEKNLGLVGDVAYDHAVGKPDSWTDPRQYNPFMYADSAWDDWSHDPKNRAAIVAAHDTGLDIDGDGKITDADLSGGQAVYAAYLRSLPQDQGLWVGENSFVSQLMRASALDPLVYAAFASKGLGAVARVLDAKIANGVELTVAEKMLRYAATTGEHITTVPNKVADAPFDALGRGFGKITGKLFKPSEGALAQDERTAQTESVDALRLAREQEAGAPSTATATGPVVGAPASAFTPPAEPGLSVDQSAKTTYVKLPDGQLREATPAEIALAGKGNDIELVTDPLANHWLNPETGRAQPEGTRAPSTYEYVKGELARTNPAAAAEFDRQYKSNPKTVDFINRMQEYDASPDKAIKRSQGLSGNQLDSVDQVLTGIEHAVEVQRPLLRDVTGDAPPPWRFDYHDPESQMTLDTAINKGGREGTSYSSVPDMKHVIEQAVFGTEDSARKARQYLSVHASNSQLSQAARGRYQELLDRTSHLRNLDSWSLEPGTASFSPTEKVGATTARPAPAATLPPQAVTAPPALERAIQAGTTNRYHYRKGYVIDRLTDEVVGEYYGSNAKADVAARQLNAEFKAQPKSQPATARPNINDMAEVPPGMTLEAPPVEPTSYVTEASRHAEAGRITPQQADILNTPVAFGNETMTFAELFDKAAVEAGSDERGMEIAQVILNKAKILNNRQLPRATRAALRAWDKAGQITKEAVQYNVVTGARGSIGDAIGDAYSLLVTGHGQSAIQSITAPLALAGQLAAAKVTGVERGNLLRILRAVQGANPELLNDLPEFAPIREAGVTLPRDYQPRSAVGRDDALMTGETALHQTVMGVTGGRGAKATGAVAGIFANKALKDFRTALDTQRRIALYTDQFRGGMGEAIGRWGQHLDARAAQANVSPDDWWNAIQETAKQRAFDSGKTWSGMFSPDDVGIATGSTDLSRQWRSELNGLNTAAKKEVDRVLFSYKRTNADEVLSRAVFFHYWQSRALVLHTRTALKNPFLMATYYRTWQALKAKAEKDGYPASVKGFLQFMGDSKDGWYGLFNPLGVIVPYSMFTDSSAKEDAPFWQRIGLFLNPMLEGAAAAVGMTDSVPDPSGTYAVRNMVRAVQDWANAHGIPAPGGDTPSEDYVRTIEERVYSAANAALQKMGVTGKEYGPYDPHDTQMVQLREMVQQEAIKQYGPAETWDATTKALVDDALVRVQTGTKGNALSEQVYKDWTDQQLTGRLTGAAIPGGVRTVYAPLVKDRELSAAGHDALNAGQEPTPEQQDAMDRMSKTNTGGPEDLALTSQQDAYLAIGTERQQNLSKGWSNIAYGKDLGSGYYLIDGKIIQTSDLMRMSTDDRKVLADRWIANHEGKDELKAYRTERDAFVADHPEYGDFNQYGDAVHGYKGGPSKFRQDLSNINSGFAAAVKTHEAQFKDKPAAMRKKEMDDWTDSMAAYEAASGIQASIYDATPDKPKPDATWKALAAQDTILSGGGTGGSGGFKPTDKVAKLKKDLGEVETKRALFMQATGYPIEQMHNPIMEAQYRAQGLWVDVPQNVQLYLDWKSLRPQGSDVSPEAFYAFVDSLAAKAAA